MVYLALITNVPKVIVEKLQKLKKKKKKFMAKLTSYNKHRTLSNTFETGGLKIDDINLKFIGLHCSWV